MNLLPIRKKNFNKLIPIEHSYEKGQKVRLFNLIEKGKVLSRLCRVKFLFAHVSADLEQH